MIFINLSHKKTYKRFEENKTEKNFSLDTTSKVYTTDFMWQLKIILPQGLSINYAYLMKSTEIVT